MTLRDRAIQGVMWSFTGSFANQVISFFIGIILARLLSPREYGLVGMVTIFIVLTQPFIHSGFSQALIRKNNCTDKEFSTIFYFNVTVGVFFYFLIFLAAPYVGLFFGEPQIVILMRVISLIIIIDAISIIQKTILIKNVEFKLPASISLASIIIGGIVGIYLAYNGYGVWSLVYKSLTQQTINSLLLWILNGWKPKRVFSFAVIKDLFGFSSKLLASAVLDAIYYNIYTIIIAKFFSARQLGLFTRAKMFNDLVSQNISEIIGKVSFPVLASIQNEPQRLEHAYKRIFLVTNFIIIISMFGLAASAEPLIITLIGEKWLGSVIYLQLLCFVGIYYPTHVLTKSILLVYGKSGLFFKLQIFTKILAIPAISAGIIWGIKYMIIAMIITGFIEFLFKAHQSGKIIGYAVWEQLKDLRSTILLAIMVGLLMYLVGNALTTPSYITLIIQITSGILLTFLVSDFFRLKEYLLIKSIILNKIAARINSDK